MPEGGQEGRTEDEEEVKEKLWAELYHWKMRYSSPSGAASVIKNGCSLREFAVRVNSFTDLFSSCSLFD